MTDTEDDDCDKEDTLIQTSYHVLFDDFEAFLKESAHLFALMGVFTAAAIYLREISLPESSSGLERFIMFSSFGIVLLLLFIVCAKAMARISHPSEPIIRPQNYLYMIFFILLAPIMMTLTVYLSSFSSPAMLFWGVAIYVLTFSLIFYLMSLIYDYGILEKLGDRIGIEKTYIEPICFAVTGIISLNLFLDMYEIYGAPVEMLTPGDTIPVLPLLITYLAAWWTVGSIVIVGFSILDLIADRLGAYWSSS